MSENNLNISLSDTKLLKKLSDKVNSDPIKKEKVKRLQQIIKENRKENK